MNFLLAGDWMRPYVDYIPPLLESGIKVLIYAGDADYSTHTHFCTLSLNVYVSL